VAVALLRGHRALGLDVAAMKPAQSGAQPGVVSDAERLAAAAGGGDDPALVCPYSFAAPLAPAVAARLEGGEVSLERILECAAALARRHAALLVEGAGGLLAPLTERHTCADLAEALGLPVLVVARAGLGTVNHTALTCEVLRARNLAVAGVVLNRIGAAADASEPHNPGEIERLTGVRVMASLPFLANAAGREAILAAQLAAKVQF
jgi:dethiobiotin synthetase